MKTKLNPIALGMAIREARDAARMSANDLAAEAGMTPSSLSRTENGFRSLELSEAILIAEATRTTLQKLIELATRIQDSGESKQREQAKAELERSKAAIKETANAVLSDLKQQPTG